MFETPNGAHYRQERIEVADFFTNKHVDEMILQTEVRNLTFLRKVHASTKTKLAFFAWFTV